MGEVYNSCIKTPRWDTPWLPVGWPRKILYGHVVGYRKKSSNLRKSLGDRNFKVVDNEPKLKALVKLSFGRKQDKTVRILPKVSRNSD